jgi:hypothetical protein
LCFGATVGRGGDPPPIRFVQSLFVEFTGPLFLGACMGLAPARTDLYLAVGCLATSLQYAYVQPPAMAVGGHVGACVKV